MVKKTVTREGVSLTKVEGAGKVHLADEGKKISIINLDNQSIYVNGNDLIAFEDSIQWDIKLLKKVAGIIVGGLFNVKLEGTGMVAITTHYATDTQSDTGSTSVYRPQCHCGIVWRPDPRYKNRRLTKDACWTWKR